MNFGWIGTILAAIVTLGMITVAVTHTETANIITAAGNIFTTGLGTAMGK